MKDFEKIYLEYYDTVFQYVLSLCKDEQWAEELTQEAFFKALKNIGTFRGECKLSVWLCQIAKNTYFKAIAKQKHIVPEMETVTTAPALDVETDCLDREDAKKIHILLHNLNEPYKEVFMLRVFGELPFSQIGELFGKTDSWARLIFYRAKKQLQEAMK